VLLNPDGSPLVLVAENDVRANITHRTYNDVLPLLMASISAGIARPGRDGDDRRLHVRHGGKHQRLRHRLDLRRLPAADPPRRQRPALPGHGPLASLLGVVISIGTAYMLFYFSNILEFLQVLVFFFIVPLFGVVILGMLWKRCSRPAVFGAS